MHENSINLSKWRWSEVWGSIREIFFYSITIIIMSSVKVFLVLFLLSISFFIHSWISTTYAFDFFWQQCQILYTEDLSHYPVYYAPEYLPDGSFVWIKVPWDIDGIPDVYKNNIYIDSMKNIENNKRENFEPYPHNYISPHLTIVKKWLGTSFEINQEIYESYLSQSDTMLQDKGYTSLWDIIFIDKNDNIFRYVYKDNTQILVKNGDVFSYEFGRYHKEHDKTLTDVTIEPYGNYRYRIVADQDRTKPEHKHLEIYKGETLFYRSPRFFWFVFPFFSADGTQRGFNYYTLKEEYRAWFSVSIPYSLVDATHSHLIFNGQQSSLDSEIYSHISTISMKDDTLRFGAYKHEGNNSVFLDISCLLWEQLAPNDTKTQDNTQDTSMGTKTQPYIPSSRDENIASLIKARLTEIAPQKLMQRKKQLTHYPHETINTQTAYFIGVIKETIDSLLSQ